MTHNKMTHGGRFLAAACATSLLSGCGTIARSPDVSLEAAASDPGVDDGDTDVEAPPVPG